MTTIKLPAFQKIIWIMPVAYAFHIVEEYAGNFPGWVTNDVHGAFSYVGFDLNNIMFMVVLLTLVTLNYKKVTPLRTTALVVFASANLFWDSLFHLFTTSILNAYSPGLITAMLLYYPICILIGIIILNENLLRPSRLLLALTGGLVLFSLIVWYGLFHFAV